MDTTHLRTEQGTFKNFQGEGIEKQIPHRHRQKALLGSGSPVLEMKLRIKGESVNRGRVGASKVAKNRGLCLTRGLEELESRKFLNLWAVSNWAKGTQCFYR
jgi:hypothetical protein